MPYWEQTPADLPTAIKGIKVALRERIGASGRSVEEVVSAVEGRLATEVGEIEAARDRGEPVWPVIDYAQIAAGQVAPETVDLLHRRGCVVVRGQFDHEQARGWDAELVDYVDRNGFAEQYRGPGDDFFASVGSKPEIYPIYWSRPQMEARQSAEMARVQAFLNGLWRHESDGVQWFDPGRDSLYPDRIRRRPPGTSSAGLGSHLDPGTLDLWMTRNTSRPSGICSTAPPSSMTRGTRPS